MPYKDKEEKRAYNSEWRARNRERSYNWRKEWRENLYNAIAYLNYHDQDTDEDICYSGPPRTGTAPD